MSISDIQIGDKVFHNNAEGILDLVFIRDFTEEEERFVLIQKPGGEEDWVHESELFPWTGEEQALVWHRVKTPRKYFQRYGKNQSGFLENKHKYIGELL